MILIFSENSDQTTNLVIDWLSSFNVRWYRINQADKVKVEHIALSGNKYTIKLKINNDVLIDLEGVTNYWYRRGYIRFDYPFVVPTENNALNNAIFAHAKEELLQLNQFIFEFLRHRKKKLGDFFKARNKKLFYLLLASDAGLAIPDSIICDNSLSVLQFQREENSVVTKSIHESIAVSVNEQKLFSQTFEVLGEDIGAVSDFLPSLFQKNISKRLELRVFFLNTDLYPMAIFSQENEQTRTDFRNYDRQRPNRNVPFLLPDEIEVAVKKFIIASGLDTGSIDMILTTEGTYVFLEVNPVGQFEMVSYPCNYFLEKRVAQYVSS